MISIELHGNHNDFIPFPDLTASHARSRRKIRENGFLDIYSDAINTVFIRN